MKDLILLVADSNTRLAVDALLDRTQALGIRSIERKLIEHKGRDPGVVRDAAAFLRPWHREYRLAITICDHHGCGISAKAEDLEQRIETELNRCGWEGRAAAIVIEPELEAWLWSGSPQMEELIGWRNQPITLRDWLLKTGHVASQAETKPVDPKGCFEQALHKIRRPRSGSIYQAIAEKVSFTRCTDRSFCKFRQVLLDHFGV